MDPALRRLAAPAGICEPSNVEGELLAGIGGANLCCDVFGAHSKGERAAGLSFHGEAGLSTWEVESWDQGEGSLVLCAELRKTQLRIRRTFRLGTADGCDPHTVCIEEELTNLCSFERAMGRCQHVTLGAAFLVGDDATGRACCEFDAGCDKGHTWPSEMDPSGDLRSQWQPNAEFDFPQIPMRRRPGAFASWKDFPRSPATGGAAVAAQGAPGEASHSSDLCTLRVTPQNEHGWFTARRRAAADGADGGAAGSVVFACAWQREAFPWLMTWEENCARQEAPWSGRTVCRGLEISSYAFATGRRDNVERGRLLGTPTFEWLDADETKATTWRMSLREGDHPSRSGAQLCGL